MNYPQRSVLRSVIALLLLLAGSIWGQIPTGSIEGTVTDPSGALVPNAKVVVTEVATGRQINTTSNDSGFFTVRSLVSGRYNVRVEKEGFSAKETRDLNVVSGSVLNANTQLEVGKTGEVVQVEANAVSVDTSRQTVDSVITQKEIATLPSFSRNFLDLAALAPGVVSRDGENIDPTKANAYRAVGINGRSGTGTRVQIDGIDVTDETVGTTLSNISQDAVSEFQLTRSSLDISTSLTSSGAININSRSGSNQYHGNGFYDFFNQDLSARLNYNSTSEPIERNRWGMSMGGPIIKDKLFAFGNWERHYQTEQKILETPFFPQQSGSAGFPVGIRYSNARLDWNVNQKIRAFGAFYHSWDIGSGGTVVSPFQNVDWTNRYTVGVDINGSRTTNTFRFGYLNFNNRIQSQSLGKPFPSYDGQDYYLNVGSYASGPNSLAPQATYQDNWQTTYEGSRLFGKHTVRWGFNYTHIVLGGFANFAGPLSVYGTYDDATIEAIRKSGKNVSDPLNYPLEDLGTGPQNGFFTAAPAHGLPYGGQYNDRFAFWVGDSWKISRTFTLNVGVRFNHDTGFFWNDDKRQRDPATEFWIKGASQRPDQPYMWSPSIGFAWDVTGKGKTVIRGGFYQAYEMNIYNNTIFDASAMLPAGIGPDSYSISFVGGPDGKPINVDGRHPTGNYEDLIGLPIGQAIPTLVNIHRAVQNAYNNYKFDPTQGQSTFTTLQGNQIAAMLPGNQFKIPYSLQFNIGIQQELARGVVLTADYVRNRAVGLPMIYSDFDKRRSAETLNVAAARTQQNRVLGGLTVDQWIAANPTKTIGSFGLINDTIWPGLNPNYLRAEFNVGGFSTYDALQFQLTARGRDWRWFRSNALVASYSLSRNLATQAVGRVEFRAAAQDNTNWNRSDYYGRTGLDFRNIFSAGWTVTVPGGFRLNSIWQYRSPSPVSFTVPNLGGAVSGSQGFFATDLNGDGGRSTTPRGDFLPGMKPGEFGRSVSSFTQLNTIISNFNSTYAGKLTPHGQALVKAGLFTEAQLIKLGATTQSIPLVPVGNPWPFHALFTTNLRIDRPFKLMNEKFVITPIGEVFNLFNHAPPNTYGGLTARFGALNYDYSTAPAGNQASDLNLQRGRNTQTRRVQVGIRVDF